MNSESFAECNWNNNYCFWDGFRLSGCETDFSLGWF